MSFVISGNIDNLLSQQIIKFINLNVILVNTISFITVLL